MSEDPGSRASDHPGISRRRLLQVGAAGALLVGAAGAISLGGYRLPPGEVALGLSPKGWCVARAITEALLPEDDGLPSGVSLGVHQRLDEEAWASPPQVRDDIESALGLLEHAPILTGRLRRLSRLPVDERLLCFDALCRQRRRLVLAAAVSTKQMLHLFYYAHPATWAATGYQGPFVPEPRPPASSQRYQELLDAARARA